MPNTDICMLDEYREEIDTINDEIVDLIAERMNVVESISAEKKANGISIRDKEREEEVITSFQNRFSEKNLDAEVGGDLAKLLIDLAVKEQKDKR